MMSLIGMISSFWTSNHALFDLGPSFQLSSWFHSKLLTFLSHIHQKRMLPIFSLLRKVNHLFSLFIFFSTELAQSKAFLDQQFQYLILHSQSKSLEQWFMYQIHSQFQSLEPVHLRFLIHLSLMIQNLNFETLHQIQIHMTQSHKMMIPLIQQLLRFRLLELFLLDFFQFSLLVYYFRCLFASVKVLFLFHARQISKQSDLKSLQLWTKQMVCQFLQQVFRSPVASWNSLLVILH